MLTKHVRKWRDFYNPYCMVQYGTYCTALYSMVQYSTARHSMVNTVRLDTLRLGWSRYDTGQKGCASSTVTADQDYIVLWIRDVYPGSWFFSISDLGSRPLDPGSRIQDLGSRISDPGSRIQDLGSRISDPGSRIQDLGSRISDPSSRILDTRSWISDPGSRISVLRSRNKQQEKKRRGRKKLLERVQIKISQSTKNFYYLGAQKYGLGIWDQRCGICGLESWIGKIFLL